MTLKVKRAVSQAEEGQALYSNFTGGFAPHGANIIQACHFIKWHALFIIIVMKKKTIRLGLVAAALLLLFTMTDPQKLPSFLLIAPFIIFFLLIFYATKWIALRHASVRSRAIRLAVLCASLPTLLIVLLSLGQLTLKDVATTGALFALSYFYIVRNAFEGEGQ